MKTLMGWAVVIGLITMGRWWTEDWLVEREMRRMNERVREWQMTFSPVVYCEEGVWKLTSNTVYLCLAGEWVVVE